ncbi:MAG: T9SS type A sorting domain-containing protein [Bacteroidia bacterium]
MNTTHPITNYAGLTTGSEVDWSSQRDSSAEVTYFSLPQTAATAVANIKGESVATLWAIEPDANDASNPLNHRLVIWGVHEWGLLKPEPVFFDILDGAILWVAGQNSTANDKLIEEARLVAQPNPFSTFTQVEFNLEQAGQVSMEVFDLTGKSVSTQESFFGAGYQRMGFQRPAAMSTGMYHFVLRLDGKVFGSGKMVAN